jgi:hypothetical protein
MRRFVEDYKCIEDYNRPYSEPHLSSQVGFAFAVGEIYV